MGAGMSVPTFEERARQWSSPPVDDIGYIPSADMLQYTDDRLRALVEQMIKNRYDGWRNHRNAWIETLRFNETVGKDVLDYGCGVGVEALEYAVAGNRVSVADISDDNVVLACKILSLYGYDDVTGRRLPEEPNPQQFLMESFDVIHSAGVLHHIPDPVPVVATMHGWLRNGGELRLMLYSDKAFEVATGHPPTMNDVLGEPDFETFWQHWDPIGGYADWYHEKRLMARFGAWFDLVDYRPLTRGGEYVGAVLVKKETT